MKIDTGAGRNVMSIKIIKELFGENVKMGPPRIATRAYGNFDIKVLGRYQTYYRWKEGQTSSTLEHYQYQQLPHTTQLQNQH